MTATPALYPRLHAEEIGPEWRLGVVRWFSPAKGYGFIQLPARNRMGDRDATDIFVHHSAVVADDRLEAGDRVRFQVALGAKGPSARFVERIPRD